MPNINDLTYNGTNASSLGVYVTGSGTFNAPELDVTRYEVPGRNGDIILSNNRYKNIDVTYPAFIPDAFMGKVQSIRNWLRSSVGYARIEDTYDSDHYRMGIATELQEFSPVNQNRAANFQMVFNCKPQRFLKSGETEQTVVPMTESYSGNPASFESPSAIAMSSVSISLSPQQDLHGYDKPWAGGAGKNICPVSESSENPRPFWGGNDAEMVTVLNTLAEGTYTISNKFKVVTLPTGGVVQYGNFFIRATVGGTTTNLTPYSITTDNSPTVGKVYTESASFTITAENKGNISACYAYCDDNTHTGTGRGTYNLYDIQIERGNQATTFAPYENICPITGHDSATLYVSPTTSQADATTYPVSFSSAGTVYGGTYDWVTGVLTVTWANIASYNGETLQGEWLSSMDAYSAGTTPTTGAQVVYELATPVEYNLTPQTVSTLAGQNYVWAEETVTVQFTENFNMNNPTNYTAKPIFKITNPNNDTLTVNGQTLTIGAYTGEMIIDCETENAYAGSSNLNSLVTGTFPTLESGVNTISCSAATCKVIPRWWEL